MNSKLILVIFLSLFYGLVSKAEMPGLKLQEDSVLGEKVWSLARLSVSNIRSKPEHSAELVSQALMGTPMKVLEYSEGWYKVQTPENYVGWMDEGGLVRLSEVELMQWKTSNRYIFNRITGSAFDRANRNGKPITDLVLGDIFEVETETHGYLKVRLPDGRNGFVKKSECISWTEWIERKPDDNIILDVARQLLGSPYMWGGTSCKAMDCSGLTKTVYFSQGIILARDASQQARYGQHPDFKNITSLLPGDLLFFGRSADRIIHVGIYLENGKYIHASGLVQISSIDPNDPAYNVTEKKNLVAASRILNSLNTEGIILVKDHPWYSHEAPPKSSPGRGLEKGIEKSK